MLDDAKSLMDLGKRVSRKKDFIPAVTATIKKGWKPDGKRVATGFDSKLESEAKRQKASPVSVLA